MRGANAHVDCAEANASPSDGTALRARCRAQLLLHGPRTSGSDAARPDRGELQELCTEEHPGIGDGLAAQARGGVLSRSTTVAPTGSTVVLSVAGSSASRTACSPTSSSGTATVVSAGVTSREVAMSS